MATTKAKATYKADARDGDGDGLVQDGSEFERPEGYELGAVDGDGDGTVQDGTPNARPVSRKDELPKNLKDVVSIKYIGTSDVRELSDVDLGDIRDETAYRLTWDASNNFVIPAKELPMNVLEFLSEQPDFFINF
jgi:hypothetical protein